MQSYQFDGHYDAYYVFFTTIIYQLYIYIDIVYIYIVRYFL